MDVNFEYIDPFDEKYDYLMRIEHLGRYYFATDVLKNFNTILDVACADGYGTYILSENVSKVIGVDRNEKYLKIANKNYNNRNIEFKCINVDENKDSFHLHVFDYNDIVNLIWN